MAKVDISVWNPDNMIRRFAPDLFLESYAIILGDQDTMMEADWFVRCH